MKIELVQYNRKIYVDGVFFGDFREGCYTCSKRSAILRGGKLYGLIDYNSKNIEQAVKEIIAQERSICSSRQFAEELLDECEKCFNEPVLVEK